MGILQIFTLLGALGMFLYGMNLMSSGLQKAAGDRLRGFLSAMTSSPYKGVLTGLGITTVIQSSSATTVMVVSFVNAGLLTLAQAISVIMGANIGTTVTAWLVSWLGFKAMYKIIGELESLGDSGESISRILSRKNVHKKEFDAEALKKLNSMVDLVDNAYEAMIENLKAADIGTLEQISNANAAEDRINNQRNYLRDEEIESIESGNRNYQTSVYYMDVVNELEKMGDFIINISQDLHKTYGSR